MGRLFGIWSWAPPRPELTPEREPRLVIQSVVGLPLTALAARGLARPAAALAPCAGASAGRLLVALAPLAGIAAVLYYATRGFRADGDMVKAMFMLTAVPAWALSFGFAADVLVGTEPALASPVLVGARPVRLVSLAFATFASVS